MRRQSLYVVVPLLLSPAAGAACGGAETRPPAAAARKDDPALETAKHQPKGETGVDEAALDKSASPCDDFYQYACGGFLQKTTIPDDEAGWYRSFNVIRDRNEEILRGILEGYAKSDGSSEAYARELGDFYASCMDEDGIEKAALAPIEPWLASIAAVKDAKSLTQTIGKLSDAGLSSVLDVSAAQDFGDAKKTVAMISQGGLGMPEREYYLEDSPKMKELRGKYLEHVKAMLKAAGDADPKATASAKAVLEVETGIAAAWMSKEDRREPKKIHHHAMRAELATLAPGFDWETWLSAAGGAAVKELNVNQPDFVKAIGQMIGGKVPLASWKIYLRWQVLRQMGDYLPKRFVDEKQRWRETLLGAKKLPERWKRCVRAVDAGMGEALAQPFVKKTLGSEGKTSVLDMVQAIERGMNDNLQKLPWMDETTRKAAFAKLGKIANKIAYPDKWRSYSGLVIKRDRYASNVAAAAAFELDRQIAKVDKPIDRSEWQMSPPTVNAYYDAQLNEMVFPAGILQPPFYANAAPLPTNYGGIGMVMGHELTHGFDDEGRQFDGDGNLRDWWSKTVDSEFDRRASCVKNQYDNYTVLDGLKINGKLTLGENIADLGGVKLALRALDGKLAGGVKDLTNPHREFFLGFAQGWCGKMRDEAMRHLVTTNSHSPPHLRVNGPLSNLPTFAEAFHCRPGDKMVRKDRCEVW
jgi:putative endopeptidase